MSACAIEPKPGVNVGRVVAQVAVFNADDFRRRERGEGDLSAVRTATVTALVDTGATFFCLPEPLIVQLGLSFSRTRETRTPAGVMTFRIYGGARIEIEDRSCEVEVLGLRPDAQPLLGQIPLESLDYWIDPVNRRLVGNPEHGGKWMAEAF